MDFKIAACLKRSLLPILDCPRGSRVVGEHVEDVLVPDGEFRPRPYRLQCSQIDALRCQGHLHIRRVRIVNERPDIGLEIVEIEVLNFLLPIDQFFLFQKPIDL